MEPTLDYTSPLTKVLKPGERLIWVGHPTDGGFALPPHRYLALIVVGFGYLFEQLVSCCIGAPLPAFARMELFVVGMVFMAPVFWFRRLDRQTQDTTYAVTNKRLLMAVGPDRGQIREVALAALTPVRIRYRHRYGRILDFRKPGQSPMTSVWTFLDSGKPDKWFTPWIVDNQESVCQLIETARDNYWFGPRDPASQPHETAR